MEDKFDLAWMHLKAHNPQRRLSRGLELGYGPSEANPVRPNPEP